jgi:hypothetical protein
MAEEKSSGVELLKYPVTVFSILLALIIAKYTLGISFGVVAEVGPGGVKFAQDAKAEIADIAGKLNGAIVAIEELKKQSGSKEVASSRVQTAIFAATQTVSDQTAQLAKLSSDQPVGSSKQKGFIWIGDYKNGWTNVKLGAVDTGQPITASPETLLSGTEYSILGNMVVRDGLPSNDSDYFRGRKSLGVIPRGTKVRLVRAPVPIDREFAVQYWAEVELP